MKCATCGSPFNEGQVDCEYCNAPLSAKRETAGVETSTSPWREAAGQTTSTSTRLDDKAIFRVPTLDLPTNPFRWWAFFFPVGYLAGWGRTGAAGLLVAYLLAGPLVAAMIAGTSVNGARIVLFAWNIFVIYYSVQLARRVDLFTNPKPSEFGLPAAIGFTLLHWVLAVALTSGF